MQTEQKRARNFSVIIHDISLPVSESLVVWPGEPPVEITHPQHLDRGDAFTVSHLDMGAHIGTHVDAPAHFIRGGTTVDQLDLGCLVGPCFVAWASTADQLSASVLDSLNIPPGAERILFRTRNSDRWRRGETSFTPDFVAMTDCGARWLVRRGACLVGIDYLSIGPFDDPVPAHEVLMSARVAIVEGLNLDGIAAGPYQLVCLPLRLANGEGAPARAILIEDGMGGADDRRPPS